MAVLLSTTGSQTPWEDTSLKGLQRAVSGYIEIIGLPDGKKLVVNEEGKLRGLLPNETATILHRWAGGRDIIVGDAVLCERGEIN